MKKASRIIGILTSAVLMLSALSAFAFPLEGEPALCTEEEYRDYVQEAIAEAIVRGHPDCVWDETTGIFQSIPLYDFEGNCNGYLYRLQTNGEITGYLQVNGFDGFPAFSCLSFMGFPAVEGMEGDIYSKIEASPDQRLYFGGGLSYFLRTEDGHLRMVGTLDTYTYEEANEHYQSYLQKRRERIEQSEDEDLLPLSADESTNFLVRASSFSLVQMSDFSDLYAKRPNGTMERVSKHCSPTAAVNIMNYFRANGASSLDADLTDKQMFMDFYYDMDTNKISSSNQLQNTGTTRTNVEPGYTSFCQSWDCTPSELGTVTSVTERGLKQKLQSGCLLHLCANNFENVGNHDIVVFDYSGSSLYISTGYDTLYHWYSFDDLDISRYIYVRY